MKALSCISRKRRLISRRVLCAAHDKATRSSNCLYQNHVMSTPLPPIMPVDTSTAPCPIWPCPPTSPPSSHPELLAHAISHLRSGHVIGIPTETVYGLAGSAFSTPAIQLIFAAKGRPSDNPLIVHSHSIEAVEQFCQPLTATQRRIAEAFWPGPLTLLLTPRPASPLSALVTAGQPSVGVRIPSHPTALALLRLSGLPLAAPSANLSGRPSPTTAAHVLHDLGTGRGVSGIIDGGDTHVGLESSVVQCSESATHTADGHPSVDLHILRPGAITAEHLRQLLPHARIHSAPHTPLTSTEAPLAPGMKYTHYKPNATVRLLDGTLDWRSNTIHTLHTTHTNNHIAILTTTEENNYWTAEAVRRQWGDSVRVWCVGGVGVEGLAAGLFGALRALDALGVDVIVAPVVPSVGLGEAVMNRMSKAAGGEVWRQSEDNTSDQQHTSGQGTTQQHSLIQR